MNPKHFGDYVAFLAGAEDKQKAPGNAAAGAETGASPTAGGIPSGQPGDQPVPGAQTGQTPAAKGGTVRRDEHADQRAGTPAAAKAPRPPSPPVRIEKAEREFIGRLVPLLPTPRIAKRLVNVYRVIKSGKSAEALDAFEREGRATTCLLMLAILFGRPGIAAELLRALHERKPPFEKPDETFIAALRRRLPLEGEPANVRDSWDKLVGALEAIGITESVGDCAREPMEVARYSLVSGHDWHTWNNPPATTTKEEPVGVATTSSPAPAAATATNRASR
jgi:hypothetical protein